MVVPGCGCAADQAAGARRALEPLRANHHRRQRPWPVHAPACSCRSSHARLTCGPQHPGRGAVHGCRRRVAGQGCLPRRVAPRKGGPFLHLQGSNRGATEWRGCLPVRSHIPSQAWMLESFAPVPLGLPGQGASCTHARLPWQCKLQQASRRRPADRRLRCGAAAHPALAPGTGPKPLLSTAMHARSEGRSGAAIQAPAKKCWQEAACQPTRHLDRFSQRRFQPVP